MNVTNQPSAAAIYATLLAIAEKSVLVRQDTVETFCGWNTVRTGHAIDEGKLRWVFDFNNGGSIRELRFLALEIFRPEAVKHFTLETALKVILSEDRQKFGCGEIVRRFRISRNMLNRLYHDGYLPGSISGRVVTWNRPALETFLRTRWIGGAK